MEKNIGTHHVESASSDGGDGPISYIPKSDHVPFTAEEERKLLWKIDLRLIPWLAFLYLLSFLDRANIGNAKLEGLLDGLKIDDSQYLWGLTIFFISYAFFEVPSNVLLKRLKPHIWLPAIMVAWGIIMTLMGIMHNYPGLLATRWFLGIAEAGLFPGVNYYLSCWYKRSEFGIRAAIFFSAATVSGAFGGLLAAGIAKMSGTAGVKGWAWIFILEGIVTVVVGVASYWVVQDFPDTATFLTDRERSQVIWRLQQDQQASAGGEAFKWSNIFKAFLDIKTWIACAIYMGCVAPLYAFSLFLPTIIKELGYTSTRAQLYSVPPYVLAAITTIAVGFMADRFGRRGLFSLGCLCVAITGYSILLSTGQPNLSYAGVFLAAAGVYPLIPNSIAWVSNNFEGAYKRGVALAIFISWGNLNGAVSSNIYRARDRPRFKLGHSMVLGYLGLCFVSTTTMMLYLTWENKKRAAGQRDYRIKNGSAEETAALGDQHPSYRYVI